MLLVKKKFSHIYIVITRVVPSKVH